MATHDPMSYCELYWFMRDDEILYVGISKDARTRWVEHGRNHPVWMVPNGGFALLLKGHRGDLALLEQTLIARYNPIGNVSRQLDRGSSPNTPPCPHGIATSRCQACKSARVLARYHRDPEYRARNNAKSLERKQRARSQRGSQ